jgi:hypothetical protein
VGRQQDFLRLARRAIYAEPSSPYLALLRAIGCEYGDLEQLVQSRGLETALETLLQRGIYLSVDEFKGRRAVRRGDLQLGVTPDRLRNPWSVGRVPVSTGASRGVGTAVPIDFPHIRDRAVNTLLGLEARGGADWLKAHWHVPGGGVLARLLEFSSFGLPVVRWFSQVDPSAPGLHPRYRWSARALRWASLLARQPLPAPEHVPLDAPLPIADWMQNVLRSGRTPHLFCFVSSAVRLCRAAAMAGVDLSGVQFTVTGEPLTDARLAAIRQTGAQAVARYAVTECGALGFGCLAPAAADDVHLLHDLHAVVQGVPPGETSIRAGSLFITTLRPTAPFFMLNVSMGDQAVLSERSCGCPLEALGWTTHLHTIRSFEKLTAGGMTFLDTDVIRVLEEVLPARFGGGPTDYQLLEEDVDGRPRVCLLINPSLGSLDLSAVAETFLDAIGGGSGVERVMELAWREAGLVEVRRELPRSTPAGKILHLHEERSRPIVARQTG